MVELIGNIRTVKGLRVKAKLVARNYPTGVTITKAQMNSLALHPQAFHAETPKKRARMGLLAHMLSTFSAKKAPS
ncbi:MAG: hypothetical protein ABSC94_28135 [Polyangiaceae bacterium]